MRAFARHARARELRSRVFPTQRTLQGVTSTRADAGRAVRVQDGGQCYGAGAQASSTHAENAEGAEPLLSSVFWSPLRGLGTDYAAGSKTPRFRVRNIGTIIAKPERTPKWSRCGDGGDRRARPTGGGRRGRSGSRGPEGARAGEGARRRGGCASRSRRRRGGRGRGSGGRAGRCRGRGRG